MDSEDRRTLTDMLRELDEEMARIENDPAEIRAEREFKMAMELLKETGFTPDSHEDRVRVIFTRKEDADWFLHVARDQPGWGTVSPDQRPATWD
jgi:hypothetical protein